jgi:D-aspartate ligase
MHHPPAIVVGSGLSALGALRLLGRAGIPAYAFGRPQCEAYSRWYRPAPAMSLDQALPEHLADYLASSPLERAVLIPASDAAVDAIVELPPALVQRFTASVCSRKTARHLTDKALFADVMEQLAVPAPRTRRVDRIADLEAMPDDLFDGAFLKPTDSARFMASYGVKGTFVSSRSDALCKARRPLAEGHRLVLQEYVATTRPQTGDRRADHVLIDGFIDRLGNVTALFARRRLRMFPLDFGNSTHMVSIPTDSISQAADSLVRVARHLPCRGIVSGEFKEDLRDGTYKLLEINARAWWMVEYAGRCGVDVCSMSYQDALELPVEPVTSYRTGVRFFHAYYDYHAIRTHYRQSQIGLMSAARSWIGAQEAIFNWTDPLPLLIDTTTHWKARNRAAAQRKQSA